MCEELRPIDAFQFSTSNLLLSLHKNRRLKALANMNNT